MDVACWPVNVPPYTPVTADVHALTLLFTSKPYCIARRPVWLHVPFTILIRLQPLGLIDQLLIVISGCRYGHVLVYVRLCYGVLNAAVLRMASCHALVGWLRLVVYASGVLQCWGEAEW